jgi:selenocysteine-specific elongation factor
LADAVRPLSHNSLIDFYSGSQETPAKVRLLDVEELKPGQSAWAQIRLSRPAVVARRDRFILRIPSPSSTVGGGEVIDVHPRYHRRFQQPMLLALETLERGSPDELVLAALDKRREVVRPGTHSVQGLVGYELAAIAKQSNLAQDVTLQTLETLLTEERVRKAGVFWFAQTVWEALKGEAVRLVSEQHRQHPLRSGLSKEEWRARLNLSPKMAAEVFLALQEEGQLAEVISSTAATGGFIRIPGFVPELSAEQKQQVERLLHMYQEAPFMPPGRTETEAIVGSEVLASLIEQGRLVKLGNTSEAVFFLRENYEEAIAKLVAYLQEHKKMTAAEARDVLGTTRKYILPLLEHMDERHITRRVGDERILGSARL